MHSSNTRPSSAGNLPPSQQAAADAVYHEMLRGLTPEDLDFVRNDDRWPVIRTSANKTAINYGEARKKGDWSAQRNRFIKQVFLTMSADSERDEAALLDLMFTGGEYDWLKDTARVVGAVQARYKGDTRAKVFTALSQLCELKCGAYLAESCFDEEFKQAKMAYVVMQKTPNGPPPINNSHADIESLPDEDIESLPVASTLTTPNSGDYNDGCPQKVYAGRDPTLDERREWEIAATEYYQFLQNKYQVAIETLRLDVFTFLSQDNLNISKFLDRHCARAKKTGLKGGLEKTRAYFALASLYGDVGGSYEPERLDWYRAQFATELPEPLPARCMFVHVTEAAVTMVLRDGNKNGQNVNQDLTATTPRLAEMLRLWMHHAASAQPDNAHPFVIFKTENKSYGTSYDNSGAHGKLVARAWKVARCNPQDDADKEWANNDKHGLGCDWARKVTGRARRGVVCKEGEQCDDVAAAAQGHSATTERASYRAL